MELYFYFLNFWSWAQNCILKIMLLFLHNFTIFEYVEPLSSDRYNFFDTILVLNLCSKTI